MSSGIWMMTASCRFNAERRPSHKMTREEAIEYFESLLKRFEEMRETETSYWGKVHTETTIEAIRLALSSLRPVSRERVEKVFPGCEKCRNQANWPSWIEKGFVYCPKCGTPLTSWAWEKQMKRLEALYGQENT